MRKFIILLIFAFPISNAFAFKLSNDAYNDFEGNIDGKYKIYISLYPSSDGTIKGHYFYTRYEKKIPLTGKFSGNKIKLNELNNAGEITATFTGKLAEKQHEDLFYGRWKQAKTNKSMAFRVSLLSIISARWNRRYEDMGAPSDKIIETFAKRVKTSILKSDYGWLSHQISYPIKAKVNGVNKTIKTRKSFLNFAPEMFTADFRKKLAQSPTTDMFSKYSGTMIGDGEIWMSYVANTEKGPFRLKITTINN